LTTSTKAAPTVTTGYVVDYRLRPSRRNHNVLRCTRCDGSGQTAEYLLRFLGYALLGRNVEQRLTFIVGPKRTGKSKALEISARVLGPDYAIISQPKPITRSKFGTHHDSETWSIRGKRLVAISETDAGMDLDEAMVKNLTPLSNMQPI
jgi:phage/plasmid-associated DNA primase